MTKQEQAQKVLSALDYLNDLEWDYIPGWHLNGLNEALGNLRLVASALILEAQNDEGEL